MHQIARESASRLCGKNAAKQRTISGKQNHLLSLEKIYAETDRSTLWCHVYREKLPFDFGIGGGSGKNQKQDRATKQAGSSTWERDVQLLLERVKILFYRIGMA